MNACGDPYLINATTKRGTIPLVACPGWAGLTPTPTVTVRVGDEVLISGVPKRASLSKRPENLTRTRGSTYVAVRPGRTVVTIHNFLCRPSHTGQPPSCPLVAILAV